MKLKIQYTQKDTIFNIVNELIEKSNNDVKLNRKELGEEFFTILQQTVSNTMKNTLNLLLDQSNNYSIELDLIDLVGNAFKSSTKLIFQQAIVEEEKIE